MNFLLNTGDFLYAVLLFLAFGFYSIIGIAGYSFSPKSAANRLFFLVVSCLGIWTLGLSFAALSPDPESALFWRRFAALGWGPFYSMLLHYIALLTGNARPLRRPAIMAALYLPAAVITVAYAFVGRVARQEFILEESIFGWQNLALESLWNTLFNSYYLAAVVISLGLIVRWGYRNRARRKLSIYILSTFAAALIIGTLTDTALKLSFLSAVPNTAPLLIMLPLWAIYRGMERRELIPARRTAYSPELLNDDEQLSFYRYAGYFFRFAALLNFVLYFFDPGSAYRLILFSALLYTFGSIFQLLPHLPLKPDARENSMVALVGITLPVIILWYMRDYGSNIVWPLPVVFLGMASVFRRKKLIYVIVFSGLASGIIGWILMPSGKFPLNSLDHIARLMFYLTGALLALYVQGIYFRRLRENYAQIQFQKLMSHISIQLVTVSEDTLSLLMEETLRKIGEFFQAEHAAILRIDSENRQTDMYFEWTAGGIAPEIAAGVAAMDLLEIIEEYHSMREPVLLPDVGNSLKRDRAREYYRERGCASAIAIPLRSGRTVRGFFVLGYREEKDLANDAKKGNLGTTAILLADILEKITKERRINHMAYYDALTNLPNRALFYDRLRTEMAHSKRSGEPFGVMLMDLDSFKTINDSLGHDTGDTLLIEVSRRLTAGLRSYDTVSRFGGDEFLFILPQMNDRNSSEVIARKLLATLSAPMHLNDITLHVTGSAGIALYPTDAQSEEDLIKKADIAMYRAKELGRNGHVNYSETLESDSGNKVLLTNELYEAIERDELLLHYQPQVLSETTGIIGLEALIRWQHPEKGMIPPGQFISHAEQSDLIHPIGNWVIDTACRDLRALIDAGHRGIRMAINLSLKQFLADALLPHIRSTLERYDLRPEMLEFEITESIAMGQQQPIIETIAELRKFGVSLSIDDFGTQYSSLSRLSQLPFDRIKIDRQFVMDLEQGDTSSAIIGFIIELSKNMGYSVIAEGVETKEQFDYLRNRGCGEIQGFYFHKPMPFGDLLEILVHRQNP
jgi:diguanylate cyclase (GGDEF)-like protein